MNVLVVDSYPTSHFVVALAGNYTRFGWLTSHVAKCQFQNTQTVLSMNTALFNVIFVCIYWEQKAIYTDSHI